MNFNSVTFFEKPGCATNAKQKKLLQRLGVTLNVIDLLTHPFTKAELFSFFQGSAAPDWFNLNAPKIKSGEIDPKSLSEDAALALMLKEPLLICRPLLVIKGKKVLGFDLQAIETLLGLGALNVDEDLHSCSA